MNPKIAELLNFIYESRGPEVLEKLLPILEEAKKRLSSRRPGGCSGFGPAANAANAANAADSPAESTAPPADFPLDEGDAILITYADQFREEGRPPLAALKDFLDAYLLGSVRGVHILPFSPYSSDDGFSVIDFRKVNPEWGSWKDIEAIAENYSFMADLVLNHCSKESDWFRAFLRDEEPCRDYFITIPPGTDVSQVFRPRTHPLLTEFQTAAGPKLLWTTFSDDQIDLNYANPDVFLEMCRVFLMYIEKGARIVRLDAIAYLWKELGTPCLHHPKTHGLVKLLRAITDEVCPWVIIITETNVPHKENLSYFGNGDEARMVYQFALPPLVLHAFIKGDSRFLQQWAGDIRPPGGGCTFFNFCASHDGIGVLPARGILPDEELAAVFAEVEKRGGLISYKAAAGGNIPYELNINYFSAVAEPDLEDSQRVRKFAASQAILLAMPGVPGIYVHSLIGSQNWREGARESGINRRINRQKLDYAAFRKEMACADSLREQVFSAFENLLAARTGEKAFHPLADFRVLPAGRECFALLRSCRPGDGKSSVLCLTNLCPKEAELSFAAKDLGMGEERYFTEIISGDMVYPTWETEHRFSLTLEPFEVLWLKY